MRDALAQFPDTRVLCLAKVGKEVHLRDLLRGNLRFRSLEYYRSTEAVGKAHYDGNEGLLSVFQAEHVELLFSTGGKTVRLTAGTGLTRQVIIRQGIAPSILCMHAIHTGQWTHRPITEQQVPDFQEFLKLPLAIRKFGDHVWILTDPETFQSRLQAATRRESLDLRHDLVRYVDFSKVHGKVPRNREAFVKSDAYAHEREFRIMVASRKQLADPFTLAMGDLSDVSLVMPLADFVGNTQVFFPDADESGGDTG